MFIFCYLDKFSLVLSNIKQLVKSKIDQEKIVDAIKYLEEAEKIL